MDKLPLLSLLAFVCRLVVFGASIGDAIVATSLCALVALQYFLAAHKPKQIGSDVVEDLNNLKSAVAAIKLGKSLGR